MTGTAAPARPMTGDEIAAVPLARAGIGRRGYDTDAVDSLLDHLARQADQQAATISELLDQLAASRQAHAHAQDAQTRAAALSQDAVSVLSSAQQTADRLVRDAQHQVRLMIDDTHDQARQILAHAEQAAEQAAQQYRRDAGAEYDATREGAARATAHIRALLAALDGAAGHLVAVQALLREQLPERASAGHTAPLNGHGDMPFAQAALTGLTATQLPVFDGGPEGRHAR